MLKLLKITSLFHMWLLILKCLHVYIVQVQLRILFAWWWNMFSTVTTYFQQSCWYVPWRYGCSNSIEQEENCHRSKLTGHTKWSLSTVATGESTCLLFDCHKFAGSLVAQLPEADNTSTYIAVKSFWDEHRACKALPSLSSKFCGINFGRSGIHNHTRVQ